LHSQNAAKWEAMQRQIMSLQETHTNAEHIKTMQYAHRAQQQVRRVGSHNLIISLSMYHHLNLLHHSIPYVSTSLPFVCFRSSQALKKDLKLEHVEQMAEMAEENQRHLEEVNELLTQGAYDDEDELEEELAQMEAGLELEEETQAVIMKSPQLPDVPMGVPTRTSAQAELDEDEAELAAIAAEMGLA